MDIVEYKKIIPTKKSIIGFDYGTKRVGIAVSDLSQTIASSYGILHRQSWSKDLAQIKNIISEKEVGAMVFGLPLQMNGQEGEIAAEVRTFAQKLSESLNLPYFLWDERLSSSAIENFFIKEVDMSRQKRKQKLDSSAASYILQGFLDALKNTK